VLDVDARDDRLGAMQNLVHRARSVALKEERKLVLMPRETPLVDDPSRDDADREAGRRDDPLPGPGFYHGAESVEDLVDFVVGPRARSLGRR
jgi:4-hydroxy-3-polyprenylbenzoate decarboxylase